MKTLDTDDGPLLATRFRPGEIARRYGVTGRQLQRYFLQEFGVPPKAWLQNRRMSLASELLARGESVKATARHLGYTSESAFAEAYQRSFGVLPSARGPLAPRRSHGAAQGNSPGTEDRR